MEYSEIQDLIDLKIIPNGNGEISAVIMNEILTALNKNKVNKPSKDSTTEEYPFIIGINQDGETAMLEAGDLGKNIGNSDLVLTSSRVFNLNGKPFYVLGLPNKSTDTTFNRFTVQDSNGQQAYVDNIYNIFMETTKNWTDAQKIAFGNRIGRTNSTGLMSIGAIYPAVALLQDRETTYIVTGSNLNLSDSRSVELLDVNTNEILKTIPANRITVNSNTEFTFRDNTFDLGNREFKIRVWNGVANVVGEQSIRQVSNVTRRDLSNLTWNVLYNENYTPSSRDLFGGNSSILDIDTNSSRLLTDGTMLTSAKSDPLFFADEDWYLELNVNFSRSWDRGFITEKSFFDIIGICYSSSNNSFVPFSISSVGLKSSRSYGGYLEYVFLVNGNTIKSQSSISFNENKTVVFYKQENVLKVFVDGKVSTKIISNVENFSLLMQAYNVKNDGRLLEQQQSYNIINSYTINN